MNSSPAQTTPLSLPPVIRAGRRLRRLLALQWRGLCRTLRGFEHLLAEELRPSPGRLTAALRSAVILALGAGLMAAMGIDGPNGPYILNGLVGSPAAMTASSAAILSVSQALAAGSSLPIIGVLVEAPWLMVAFFALIAVILSYAMMGPLSAGKWLYVEISFLNTFFLMVFNPTNSGWAVAYTLAGGLVSFALLLLCDQWLWPVSAQRTLLAVLARDLARLGGRLALAGRHYLDPAQPLPRSTVASRLPLHLNLLATAVSEGLPPDREAILTAAVTLAARLEIEVERVLVIASEAGPTHLRTALTGQLRTMLDALDHAMARHVEHLERGLDGTPDEALAAAVAQDAAALEQLLSSQQELLADRRLGPEASNRSAFVVGMRRLVRLLERAPDAPPIAVSANARPPVNRLLPLNRAQLAHAIKVAAAMTVGFLVVITSNHAELDTVSLTVMICALPSYGATLRKMNLRLAGAALGGALAIAAMQVVSPNSETLGVYILALFAGTVGSFYAGQSSPRLAYMGKQIGVTFILAYVGLSPAANVYTPLWRIWGVFLGVAIVGLVFLVLSPDYAARSMVTRVRRLLQTSLELLPNHVAAHHLTEADIEGKVFEMVRLFVELLGVVDDARLEGTRSGIYPDQVVHACGTLRRICYRVGDLAKWRLAYPNISSMSMAVMAEFEEALRERLNYWLRYLDCVIIGPRQLHFPKPQTPAPDVLVQRLATLERHFSGPGLNEIDSWPVLAKTSLLAQVESCGRLVVLANEMDEQLSRVARRWV
ncbi:MAG TPA: FUSC family protein [Candidatus Binataceae bacterium]|nr:FUSC family protein [Candidatus Binataceae bacterium]